MKKLIFALLITAAGFRGTAQTTTIYRADTWDNIRQYQSPALASEHPVAERVNVTISGSTIKTKLGGRILSYHIVRTTHPDATTTEYSVTMNGKKYMVQVVHDGDVYKVSCTNEWALHNITEVTSFD